MNTWLYSVWRNRWVSTGFAVIVLMLLVWFLGPLIGFGALHPFETEIARYITIAALFVLWLVSNLMRELQASKRDKALAAGIASPEVAEAQARTKETERASAEEVAVLTDRLTKAMARAEGLEARRLPQAPRLDALVHDHRPPRRRQDHGHAELRAPLPARIQDRRRRGRHPQLRLDVHRRSRADRHRRPLHHAGQRRGRR